ncbi:hypothetical protein HX773_24965 [Pantoea sp. B9002]|uniref:hypothetical protein n=1 Tax=Pantoea sp. B9002 TaxID=2726979 RepID=UPI0015A18790|nr:hypothetical protein [Pantoea sp. B9002]NWA64152.1 hypothetical protein [Pantoea sp. B9002]
MMKENIRINFLPAPSGTAEQSIDRGKICSYTNGQRFKLIAIVIKPAFEIGFSQK